MNNREIIMDNNAKPFNRGLIEDDSYITLKVDNSNCIDEITLMVKIEDNIIKDIVFDGEACMIVIASTSILIKNLIGKKISEAKIILDNYKLMVNKKACDLNLLGDLMAFEDIYKQPNRISCALLSTNGFKKLLNK